MTRTKHIWLAALAGYVLMAIFTFGHSAANSPLEGCRKPNAISSCTAEAGMGGMMAAIVWPLYWSWELQQ